MFKIAKIILAIILAILKILNTRTGIWGGGDLFSRVLNLVKISLSLIFTKMSTS